MTIKEPNLKSGNEYFDIAITNDEFYGTVEQLDSHLEMSEWLKNVFLRSPLFDEEQKKDIEVGFFIMRNKLIEKREFLKDMEKLKK